MQLSTTVRNAILDGIETAVGTAPLVRIRTGSAPANCAASDTGTVLATITCPSDWLSGASAAVKSLTGLWQDSACDATGVAGHFRIYDSAGTTCHLQGSVSASGGGGEMIVDTVNFTAGALFTVTSLSLTAANG